MKTNDKQTVHLWEVKHPYYCSLNNYFSNDCGDKHESWQEFLNAYEDADFDMNLVFRWDWQLPEDDDGNKILHADPYYRDGTLEVFWMGQRKGLYRFTEVKVCRADEPAVIEFLRPRFEHMLKLWEPFAAIAAAEGPADGREGE